jgi:hypothetical protein
MILGVIIGAIAMTVLSTIPILGPILAGKCPEGVEGGVDIKRERSKQIY